MAVLLFNGSPHAAGCTYTALCEVEKALKESGVDAIWYQLGTGDSSIAPAKVRACARLVGMADGLVIGTPVYYASANGLLSAFCDRLFGLPSAADWRLKPAAAVASCRRAGTTEAVARLERYFTIREMPIVSSQYWNCVHGNTPAEVMLDTEGLQTMRTLGRNMAWLIKSIKKAAIPLPEREKQVRTNFIR